MSFRRRFPIKPASAPPMWLTMPKKTAPAICVRPVRVIKTKRKAKNRKMKRQKAMAASRDAGIAGPVELIAGIKVLAQKAGGVRSLKQVVDLLAE